MLYESEREYKILHLDQTPETWQSRMIALLSRRDRSKNAPMPQDFHITDDELEAWIERRQQWIDGENFWKKYNPMLFCVFALPFLVMTCFRSDDSLLVSTVAGAVLTAVAWGVWTCVRKRRKRRATDERCQQYVEQLEAELGQEPDYPQK